MIIQKESLLEVVRLTLQKGGHQTGIFSRLYLVDLAVIPPISELAALCCGHSSVYAGLYSLAVVVQPRINIPSAPSLVEFCIASFVSFLNKNKFQKHSCVSPLHQNQVGILVV